MDEVMTGTTRLAHRPPRHRRLPVPGGQAGYHQGQALLHQIRIPIDTLRATLLAKLAGEPFDVLPPGGSLVTGGSGSETALVATGTPDHKAGEDKGQRDQVTP